MFVSTFLQTTEPLDIGHLLCIIIAVNSQQIFQLRTISQETMSQFIEYIQDYSTSIRPTCLNINMFTGYVYKHYQGNTNQEHQLTFCTYGHDLWGEGRPQKIHSSTGIYE